jgi:hypothetical protein
MDETMSPSTLSNIKDIATIVGVVIAVVTLLKGYLEYRRNACLARIQHFSDLKKEFKEDPVITKITELLETKDPTLADVSRQEKWRFLCFFEEITILLRAGLITDVLACYMFGYYAILCDRSEYFWTESFLRDEEYWLLFFDFLAKMKSVESLKEHDRNAFVAKIHG